MVDISGLNKEQKLSVETIQGPLMILAGAGTGKTRVITYRIGHMITRGVPAEAIVALTFTNKAAREMKERVKDLVGDAAKQVTVGTFHSFCIRILRRFSKEAELDKFFSLAGTSDQIDLVRRSLDEKGWSGLYKPEEILTRISNAKNALLSPENILEADQKLDDPDPNFLQAVYHIYERQLTLNRVIDFDDCILKVAKLLSNRPDVLELIQEELTHFLVDEFQDTNFAQLKILELLAARHRNICVVGDDDQSIYSWRGAMVETLDRFESIFPEVKLVKLEQNYRCTDLILNAANEVIRNNSGRKDKTLWSTNKSEEYISLASKQDDTEEAKWIAEKCFGLLGRGYKLKDIGILYRANAQARSIEIALRERNLGYKVFGGSSFFERKEVKDFLAYLKMTVDPSDRMSFFRIINTPSRGIGIKTLEKIEAACKEFGKSPFEVLQENLAGLTGKSLESTKTFVDQIESGSTWPISTPEEMEKTGNELISLFGLDKDIKQKTSHEGARKRKLESLHRLPSWIRGLAENQLEDKGDLNILDLLDRLMLSDEPKEKDELGNDNYISLMTIHASKGLEFPAVFVCGIEDDLLPHKNSFETPHGLSEERRLFYVALTRAKFKLHLSYARERFSSFQKQSRKPSRFLKELPETGVITDAQASQLRGFETEAQRKEKSMGRLSSLRQSLKEGFK
ncbi:MAG: UvrD-helicase domain-containing protein [Pseudobacteriovorax sp.]|nr:UvrD-helicase domain-containing protein [Pseudobacteriovorax sp.]